MKLLPLVGIKVLNHLCLAGTIEELSSCIKRLKHGKSPGIDGSLPELSKDGGEHAKQSLLWLFNCMLAGRFPERLFVGLITAIQKSGDKSDMSNYRGMTVGSVIAKLFAMILEQRLASWAEDHAQASGKNSAQLTLFLY